MRQFVPRTTCSRSWASVRLPTGDSLRPTEKAASSIGERQASEPGDVSHALSLWTMARCAGCDVCVRNAFVEDRLPGRYELLVAIGGGLRFGRCKISRQLTRCYSIEGGRRPLSTYIAGTMGYRGCDRESCGADSEGSPVAAPPIAARLRSPAPWPMTPCAIPSSKLFPNADGAVRCRLPMRRQTPKQGPGSQI